MKVAIFFLEFFVLSANFITFANINKNRTLCRPSVIFQYLFMNKPRNTALVQH